MATEVCADIVRYEALQDTQVTINDGDKPLTIQGFKRINEEALDALSDKKCSSW